jgi:hypothetical protein
MTKAEAFTALTAKAPAGMGLTRKTANFLLDSAVRFGNGPHLQVEVFYAEGDGFAVIDYSGRGEGGGGGVWVTPGTANG